MIENGSPGILWLKGMQIVSTASLYFTKESPGDQPCSRSGASQDHRAALRRSRRKGRADLRHLEICQWQLSDLSANKPFHVKVEQLSLATHLPRWH
jgi:hypothetical protein